MVKAALSKPTAAQGDRYQVCNFLGDGLAQTLSGQPRERLGDSPLMAKLEAANQIGEWPAIEVRGDDVVDIACKTAQLSRMGGLDGVFAALTQAKARPTVEWLLAAAAARREDDAERPVDIASGRPDTLAQFAPRDRAIKRLSSWFEFLYSIFLFHLS